SNWQPAPKSGKGLSPETAIAALFGRLSAQLRSQDAENDALYFARLGQWIAPEDAAARITLARALDDVGASAKAQPLLASIPADSLHWRAAVLQQARMLSAAGDPANALRLTNDAVAKAPDSIELRLQLAQLHEEQSDFAAAEASYRTLNETIKASPRQKAVFKMLLAQLFDRQDKWAEAKVELEAAMVLDPQNPQLLNFLGYSLLERRQEIKRGFELVSRAHTLVPDSPEIADSLGWGYFLANDVENAIPLLESAVQGSLNDVTINEHLGDAYWHAGRKIDARYAWRAAALQAEDKVVERLESKLAIGLTASNAAP
ncbi:tetratricopeptide repeat protein, partial [Sphingorhabdus sp.]